MGIINYGIMMMSLLCYPVHGYPGGAPAGTCTSMTPQHGVVAQTGVAPFEVTVTANMYSDGEMITVTVRNTSTNPFRGYMIQARNQDMAIIPGFSLAGEGQLLACSASNGAVTHTENSDKYMESFNFNAPSTSMGNITMYATVVQSRNVFWVMIPSTVITDNAMSMMSGCSTVIVSNIILLSAIISLILNQL